MDTVKKRSFTLIELIIVMTLSMILILGIPSMFIAMIRSSNALTNKAETSREAYIVMAHMANVLRFAKASTIAFRGDTTEERLTATIEKGHIPLVPASGTDITYYYQTDKSTKYLYFSNSPTPNSGDVLSQYVARFYAAWDSTNKLLTIQLRFDKNDSPIDVETKIRVLGS